MFINTAHRIAQILLPLC